MIRTPHDRLFKATFSQPQHAAELLRSVLPAVVTRHIDFTTLHSHATHLPVVIPIVLHHGEDGWSEPVSLRELYDAPAAVLDDLRPYIPELTFVLDDLAPQSDAVLRARAVSAVPKLVLWALKHVRHGRDVIPALRNALDLVRGVLLATNGVAALLTVLRYIIDVSDSSEKELMKTLERTMLPDAREALMTLAERLRLEGIERGRKENQREVLLKLLSRRFGAVPEDVAGRVRGAEFEQLDRWFDRGITAPSLDAVFADEP